MRTTSEILNLIDETFKYYSQDPSRRAVNHVGECQYLTQDGKCCAVGRCLDLSNFDFENNSMSVEDIIQFGHLKFYPKYDGFPLELWIDLQLLHDNDSYWYNGKITPIGILEYEKIKEKWNN